MADVFISYHEQSAGDVAQEIADALKSVGISCWYARRDMPPGGDFARNIPPQINACRLFLLLLNDGVYQSRHVENEVGLAFSRLNKGENILILPLEIGDFIRKDWIAYYLIHTQSVKIALWDSVNKEELTRTIAELLHKTPQASKTEQSPPQASGRTINIIKGGKCGKDVAYELDENGLLTIYGNGPMGISGNDKGVDWLIVFLTLIFTLPLISLIFFIPLGIRIFLSALLVVIVLYVRHVTVDMIQRPWRNRAYQIFHVVIKDGVTSIVARAFYDCVNLESVSVPGNALIESDAFPSWTEVTRREAQ